jgi:hypothetical protein
VKLGSSKKDKLKTACNRRRTDGVAHETLIERFKHREWAKRIELMLLEIEQDEELKDTVESIIVAIAAQARNRNTNLKEKFKIIKSTEGDNLRPIRHGRRRR